MLRYKKIPSMRKVRIFCCDPDATDSSDDEDDQNSKKEKKIIREVLVPVRKYKTSRPLKAIMPCRNDLKSPESKASLSRYCGVRLRESGRWQTQIRNPLTKRREYSLHDTEEEAAATYRAKWSQFHTEMLALKAQDPVSELAALSSSSLVSCASSSVLCEQNVQEMQQNQGVFREISEDDLLHHHEHMDESLLNSTTPMETSEDVMLNWKDHEPLDETSVSPTDEPSLDNFTRMEAMFPVNDFIDATYEPLDDEYIGLADISHLPLQFKDPEFDLDAELAWSGFDFISMESELRLP